MIKKLFYKYWNTKVGQPGYLVSVDKPDKASALVPVHRIECQSHYDRPTSIEPNEELAQIQKIEFGNYSYQKHVAKVDKGCIVGPNAIILTRTGNVVIESALGHVWCLNKSSPFLIFSHKWWPAHQRLKAAFSLTHIYCSNNTLNYYHWIMDSLLPFMYFLEYAERQGVNYQIIMPARSRSFMIDSIQLVHPAASIYYWPELDGCKVEVDELYITSTPVVVPHRYALYDQYAIASLRNRVFSNLPMISTGLKMPRRFFINRQATGSRRVRNWEQLGLVLAKHDIEVVDLAQLPFIEQVTLFRNANLIIGTHGAGLTNIIFCNTEVRIVECVAHMDVPRDYTHYYRLALGVGLRHYFYQEDYVRMGQSNKDVNYDLDINVAAFDQFVSDILES